MLRITLISVIITRLLFSFLYQEKLDAEAVKSRGDKAKKKHLDCLISKRIIKDVDVEATIKLLVEKEKTPPVPNYSKVDWYQCIQSPK